MTRAQTTLDFAIGISVFLLTVGVVLTFTPTLFSSLTSDGGQQIAADSAATHLAGENLTGPSHPYLLNESRTNHLFNQTADSQSYLRTLLATDYTVNVTLTRPDGTCPMMQSSTCRLGPTPPDTSTVTSARRVVRYSGRNLYLEVSFW